MGESGLTESREALRPSSEAAFKALAGAVARAWHLRSATTLLVGLTGDLGAGKTTWVRGMLEGLGYAGRVPSPTYTLLEHYALSTRDVLHLDLYRLGGMRGDADERGEIEVLGLRDWLARDRCWLLVEWPERSAELLARCDVLVEFSLNGPPDARGVDFCGRSPVGIQLVEGLRELSESASS